MKGKVAAGIGPTILNWECDAGLCVQTWLHRVAQINWLVKYMLKYVRNFLLLNEFTIIARNGIIHHPEGRDLSLYRHDTQNWDLHAMAETKEIIFSVTAITIRAWKSRNQSSIPGKRNILFLFADRLWSPPGVLCNRYREFSPGSKRLGGVKINLHTPYVVAWHLLKQKNLNLLSLPLTREKST
jgi:hypothetical protein